MPVIKEDELAVYTHPICPFGQRAMMTAIEKLGEKGFRTIYIDLKDKPKWYGQIYDKLTVPSI